ncbi:MAG: DUF1640 domain-containing protein, partial [Magnetococcales bacterium]|nr:DUF1640 domain-containing protein [Magnetococcales bacterium]
VDAALRAELAKVESGLREELVKVDAALRAELAKVESGLREELVKVDADLRLNIKEVEAALKLEIKGLDAKISESKAETIKWMVGLALAQLAMLAGILMTLLRVLPGHP